MGNIRFSIGRNTGLLAVENPSESNSLVELTRDDVIDLMKAVKQAKVSTGLPSNQFEVGVGGFIIKDKIQNTELTLSIDDLVKLGNFVRKNKDKIASRKDFQSR